MEAYLRSVPAGPAEEADVGAYPEDAAVMYVDASHSIVRLSDESIRLWERRTREYVEEVGGGP